jgi:hypothetical protein
VVNASIDVRKLRRFPVNAIPAGPIKRAIILEASKPPAIRTTILNELSDDMRKSCVFSMFFIKFKWLCF